MKKKTISPVHRGIITIEIVVALAIILLAVVYAYPRYAQHLQEIAWGVDARNMTTVSNAAKSYIRDNRDSLINQAKRGAPILISALQLQQDGYLPAGFSVKNTADQTYFVGITRDPKFHQKFPEKLVAFVLTQGGQAFSFQALRHISQKIEGSGGYVWPENIAVGALGGWKENLTTYGLQAGRGRPLTWLSSDVLGTDTQESDRLYRHQVSGRPDLNRMHTDIDMNQKNLNKVNKLKAETGEFNQTITAENNIKSKEGWLVTGNGKGWLNETHNGGFYMSDNEWIRSFNDKGIKTGGEIHAGKKLSTDGFLQLNTAMKPGQACEIGTLARDEQGAPLFCQGSILTSIGGGGMSRAGVNNLEIVSNGSYNVLIVTISSLFNASDRTHTGYANFNVTVDGVQVGVVGTSIWVKKSGKNGHYWGYENTGVAQKQFTFNVKPKSQIKVTMVKSRHHNSSDVRVDLTS